jgi:hypothetical protein
MTPDNDCNPEAGANRFLVVGQTEIRRFESINQYGYTPNVPLPGAPKINVGCFPKFRVVKSRGL